jgi:putative glycosyltransferase (TIGR04372 family)
VFIYVACAARVASYFDHSFCDLLVTNHRPYFRDIAKMYPFQGKVSTLNADWSELRFNTVMSGIQNYDPKPLSYHDFSLTSILQTEAVMRGMQKVSLRIPNADLDPGRRALVELGLDPERWFCALHWREPTYEHKFGSNMRDVDPANYLPVIDYIIDELGGQVVQLGHPEMNRHAARPGYVDLSALKDSWKLQAFATSRSRFFIGSPSGGTGFAHAFCVPAVHVDVLDWYTGQADDWMLTPTIHFSDGGELRQQELFDAGIMNSPELLDLMQSGRIAGIKKSTNEEIQRAASWIFEQTQDITTWRPPHRSRNEHPNQFSLPIPVHAHVRFCPI